LIEPRIYRAAFVPALLATQMRNGDPARLNRVMKEVLASVKLDIAKLQAAYG